MFTKIFAIAAASGFALLAQQAAVAEQLTPPKSLGAEWGQYFLALPSSVNPLYEGATDDRCRFGQHGPYWILGGYGPPPQTRTCTLPTGRKIFFPVVNLLDISTGENPTELLAKITPCIDAASGLQVKLDGVDVPVGAANRITSAAFKVVLPAGNLFGAPPQALRTVVTDGYYVLLSALSEGAHTLKVKGTVPGVCTDEPSGFTVDLTYNLKVTKGSFMHFAPAETDAEQHSTDLSGSLLRQAPGTSRQVQGAGER